MASAVIFDLDGTIWDSHPFYAAAVGRSSAAKQKTALAELKAGVSAATVLKNGGITKSGFRGFCTANEKLALYLDALKTIRKLFEADLPLGAVTNLPEWIVKPMLACQGLDEMLGSVVTFGRTPRQKPWPDPLLLCCEELEVEANDKCWYVGDSGSDCTAAHQAGLSFAWAPWGYGTATPAGSDVVLERFADVAEL